MFTMLFILMAFLGLATGYPSLFLFASTAFLISLFPMLIFLVVVGAVAVWAFHYYR